MSELNDRKDAFENKFAHDAELQFKVEARACKLFGLWLAGELGIEGEAADEYAKNIVAANLNEPGFGDVLRTVRPDIDEKGLEYGDDALLARLSDFMAEAKQQFMGE